MSGGGGAGLGLGGEGGGWARAGVLGPGQIGGAGPGLGLLGLGGARAGSWASARSWVQAETVTSGPRLGKGCWVGPGLQGTHGCWSRGHGQAGS